MSLWNYLTLNKTKTTEVIALKFDHGPKVQLFAWMCKEETVLTDLKYNNMSVLLQAAGKEKGTELLSVHFEA